MCTSYIYTFIIRQGNRRDVVVCGFIILRRKYRFYLANKKAMTKTFPPNVSISCISEQNHGKNKSRRKYIDLLFYFSERSHDETKPRWTPRRNACGCLKTRRCTRTCCSRPNRPRWWLPSWRGTRYVRAKSRVDVTVVRRTARTHVSVAAFVVVSPPTRREIDIVFSLEERRYEVLHRV